ncbi:hypothetical protein [Novisyntrophococcus fermenticellae]|uniref:hypothetical protein n=1 Tax=Novisyntrophococcus fermenticellae TaxID=2068655 RepID=UPI001E45365C|nr:hypothetical protein [Novisyntrophococcus fermenticellae]
METENGNTAVTTATSKTGSEGKKRMEFRRIKIKDLVPASYNTRKKLKPGDKEMISIGTWYRNWALNQLFKNPQTFASFRKRSSAFL